MKKYPFIIIFFIMAMVATTYSDVVACEKKPCPHDNIDIEVGVGSPEMNNNDLSSSSSAIPYRVPEINFGPGINGVGGVVDFWAFPGVFDLNGSRVEIVPMKVSHLQWIMGTGFFKRHLAGYICYYKRLWTVTYNGQRTGNFTPSDEAEHVFNQAVQKAYKAYPNRELLMVMVQASDAQLGGSSLMFGGTGGGDHGAGAGGIGSWNALEDKHPEFGVHIFEKSLAVEESHVPISSAVIKEVKPEPGSDIDKRINNRSEALNKCKDAGEDNAALRLEQGKDHARLHLLLADESSRAAQLDNAFVQFLQSIRDLPTREGYLFLAYSQKEKGWLVKSRASLKKAGCPKWAWKTLDEWVKSEFVKEPKMKAECMMPIKTPAKKQPAKKAFKRKHKTQLELYRELINF